MGSPCGAFGRVFNATTPRCDPASAGAALEAAPDERERGMEVIRTARISAFAAPLRSSESFIERWYSRTSALL